MAVSGNEVRILHMYAKGVMDRADHHAGEVTVQVIRQHPDIVAQAVA